MSRLLLNNFWIIGAVMFIGAVFVIFEHRASVKDGHGFFMEVHPVRLTWTLWLGIVVVLLGVVYKLILEMFSGFIWGMPK